MRISATDTDDGNNSLVTYSFSSDEKYFVIDSSTGVIRLDKPLIPVCLKIFIFNCRVSK